jgi:hypothetical protein
MPRRSDSIRGRHYSDPTRSQNADNAVVRRSMIVRDYVDIVWTAEQAKVVPATVRGWATRPVAFKHAVRTGMIDGILFPEPVGARAEATHLLLYRRTQVLAYLAERARRKKADRAVPS